MCCSESDCIKLVIYNLFSKVSLFEHFPIQAFFSVWSSLLLRCAQSRAVSRPQQGETRSLSLCLSPRWRPCPSPWDWILWVWRPRPTPSALSQVCLCLSLSLVLFQAVSPDSCWTGQTFVFFGLQPHKRLWCCFQRLRFNVCCLCASSFGKI